MLKKGKNKSLSILFIRSKNNSNSLTSGTACIFYVFLLLLVILFLPVSSRSEQPRPVNETFIPINSSSDRILVIEEGEEDLSPFSWMIKLYKRYLSPVNSSRCPMYPSCSGFASYALRYHQEKGLIMTFDRLLRCGRDLEDYQLIFKRGRVLHYDPVIQTFEHNTDDSPK